MKLGRITPSLDPFKFRLRDLVMDDTGRIPYSAEVSLTKAVRWSATTSGTLSLDDTGRIPFIESRIVPEQLRPDIAAPVPLRSGELHVREFIPIDQEPELVRSTEREPEEIELDTPGRFD